MYNHYSCNCCRLLTVSALLNELRSRLHQSLPLLRWLNCLCVLYNYIIKCQGIIVCVHVIMYKHVCMYSLCIASWCIRVDTFKKILLTWIVYATVYSAVYLSIYWHYPRRNQHTLYCIYVFEESTQFYQLWEFTCVKRKHSVELKIFNSIIGWK